MDEARVEQLAMSPLAPELAVIDALASKTDLARYFGRQVKLGVAGAPITGFVDGDAQEPSRNIIYLGQGGLGLPDRDYYLKPDPKLREYRTKYQAYIAAALTAANVPNPAAAARDIVAFETRLARAHWTNVESRDAVKTYNKVAIADLPAQFPGLEWAAWTGELGIAGAPAVVIAQPSFVKALAAAVAATPMEQWKPYLKFHLVDRFAPYLHAPMVNDALRLPRPHPAGRGRAAAALEARDHQPRRQRRRAAGQALRRAAISRPTAKARMDVLVENLRAAFREGIDGLEWMGPETRKEAHAKLAAFRPKIGYPTKWRDYSALEITRRRPARQRDPRARSADVEFDLGKVGKPVDPEDWGMTPQTVNAYYNPVRNEIVFPAAILQPPFFDMAADDAVNYGGIGAVIGHEMGHGFDDQGRRYDAKGVLRDWWTAKDGEEFMRRAKGLVAQYSAIEALPGLKVNGELTLGENIGDLTGLVIAHRAYEAGSQGPGGAGARRPHRRSALLRRLGAGVAGEVPRRLPAPDGHGRRARPRHVPGDAAAAQRGGVLRRLRRQARRRAVPAARAAREDLVGG